MIKFTGIAIYIIYIIYVYIYIIYITYIIYIYIYIIYIKHMNLIKIVHELKQRNKYLELKLDEFCKKVEFYE